MDDFERRRLAMVDKQIAARGVTDRFVLDAMRKVARERFVDPSKAESAYEDRPLPIGEGQTISQPYIVALMIEAAMIRPGMRVLEVGAGSGYAAAVMAEIGAEVFAIERHAALVNSAREKLQALGYTAVHLRCGDGSTGWPEEAPFDAVLVAAAGPHIPDSLKRQLAIGGRLIMPLGRHQQYLVRITRKGAEDWHQEDLCAVAFVPLIGKEGWSEANGD